MHFSWISEVFWLHPEGREECVSRGVKALEDAGGSRGWKCYFVLFESWLWAQVCCDLNLEESHSVLGWLQLSRGCSAANQEEKQLGKASAMAQELGNKGERSFGCFVSGRTPGEQSPGETNIAQASLEEQRPSFSILQSLLLPCHVFN